MLIVLPPSLGQHDGGSGRAIDLDALSFPDLNPARKAVLNSLIELSADVDRARARLFAPASKDAEIARNTRLRSAPTMPAVERYTGVLYDGLDVRGMTRSERGRLDGRTVIVSSVFGLLGAADPIPAYRCSECAALPEVGTPERYWRGRLDQHLSDGGLVLDLRSASFLVFGRAPGAVTTRVRLEAADGSRSASPHAAKLHRGRLARALATSRNEPADRADVLEVARRAGLRIEPDGPHGLVIIAPA